MGFEKRMLNGRLWPDRLVKAGHQTFVIDR
jgi:hypothetical protein